MSTTPVIRRGNRAARRVAALALGLAAGMGAIAMSSTSPAGAQTTTAAPTTAAKKGPTIAIGDSRLGRILVDGEGLSLYMFVPDRRNVSVCEGQCLVVWPPVLLTANQTLADVVTGPGVRRSMLGIAVRPDGVRQVTYNNWPLYYWYLDTKPGDVRGQWVTNNWFVLSDDGFPIVTR